MRKATSIVKQEILAELKNGNMTVLKGLPPIMSLNYGLAMNEESKSPKPTPFDDETMGEFMMKKRTYCNNADSNFFQKRQRVTHNLLNKE
jgi:protoporphyrinogen oxidase